MTKYFICVLLTACFATVGIFWKILADRCDELREKQARQEAILLKQSEILAVNTAMLRAMTSPHSSLKKNSTGKEGLKMEAMP